MSRNTYLSDKVSNVPKAQSTGTTIVGCVFKDGIVFGADTRATNGDIVADKNCEKVRRLPSFATIDRCSYAFRFAVYQIHYITDNIRCCGAGTAADTEMVTAMISSNMELHSLSNGRTPHVVTTMTMLKQWLFR